ncbi:MAG: AAA family ATPase [Ruminococcus sp.]|nr:AAA family ATPase [Ruminococcus sp.]
MLFYKIEGIIANTSVEGENNRKIGRSISGRIVGRSTVFNQINNQDSFCFVSGFSNGRLIAGIVTNQANKVNKMLSSYLECLECELRDTVISEITTSNFIKLLNDAYHLGFVHDTDSVLENFGLRKIHNERWGSLDVAEGIIAERSKAEIYDEAKIYFCNDTLIPELNRIYANKRSIKPDGHPVHYYLLADDKAKNKGTSELLLQALFANNRLSSKHYCSIDLHLVKYFNPNDYKILLNVCVGGAVICYLDEDFNRTDFEKNEKKLIDELFDLFDRYRHQVLLIFCVSSECNNTKMLFNENLDSVNFVEIKEDYIKGAQALSYVEEMAKEKHIRKDKELLEAVDEEQNYTSWDLRAVFDDWFDNKLVNITYPQYKDLATQNRTKGKVYQKGEAYKELQSMIGLENAKDVINKLINTFKARKIYKEMGVKTNRPSMHMCFTGNPGTAKTSVARLFARIMKDNGMLAKGQFLEVGRSEIIDKYIGWTARNVQSLFSKASGGVLFIDEAYSLVDDRDGSFGNEAISTIVQEMENRRDDVMVIFAGYKDKMEDFLGKNPGMRSRIAFHVDFADYNADELVDIASLIAKNNNLKIESKALFKLHDVFEVACRKNDFGNGRYARNVIEQSKIKHDSRIITYSKDELSLENITTLTAEDIVEPAEDIAEPEVKADQAIKVKIGF